ncbi:DNA-packaging protein [Amaricoccus tamworthensis]|uniref:DNA-packaging protein n=1 Tax=Amaricoccus tamworthensis TaxID=57002 RepID=UPI003C7CEE89
MSGVQKDELGSFLGELSDNALMSLPWLFDLWAIREHQVPPSGDWNTWVILGGRGAGKTRAGSEWVRSQVEGARAGDPGLCSRVALISETLDQAREVMVFGDSGIMACSPPDRRPIWNPSRRCLEWPNGAVAQIFSASNPESLRGPQFDCAWSDELAKWRKGRDTWDMLQFGLRLGSKPRQVVTTTPRSNPLLADILDDPFTVSTRAPTHANRMHLADGFLKSITETYGNTRLGRQEIDGDLLLDGVGALWTAEVLEQARKLPVLDTLDRIVVAVDPPVSSGEAADECGIIVAGINIAGEPLNWKAEVVEDGSLHGASPRTWAERAVELFHKYRADRLVAEINQGGELVASLIRQVDPNIPYTGVRASLGKGRRAEPVAALYEQNRVRHRTMFPELEDQMAAMTVGGFTGKGSPDRVDALVWAITELMIRPVEKFQTPRIRQL